MLLKSPYTQAEEACDEISHQAAGWKRAIRDDIVALNKTRILCEIDSAIEILKGLKDFVLRSY